MPRLGAGHLRLGSSTYCHMLDPGLGIGPCWAVASIGECKSWDSDICVCVCFCFTCVLVRLITSVLNFFHNFRTARVESQDILCDWKGVYWNLSLLQVSWVHACTETEQYVRAGISELDLLNHVYFFTWNQHNWNFIHFIFVHILFFFPSKKSNWLAIS